MMKYTIALATLLTAAIPHRANAHGFVSKVQVGGSTFNGPKPGSTAPNNSPIRGITDQSPVKDIQSKDMICGFGATPGATVASAKPGDSLVYSWANDVADNDNWIHDTGPMITYMTQVPSGQTADKFDAVGAKWFKTDQVGKENNKWVQASLMTGSSFTTQIPETLADGDYLVRHEIIGLHTADKKRGAEFYPSCFQLRIKSSNAGKTAVTADPTVSFPGAYGATDPGILVDVFSQAPDGSEYKFPAGPVANVSAPGATGTSPDAIKSSSSVTGTQTSIVTSSSSVHASSTVSATTTSSSATTVSSCTRPIVTSTFTTSSVAPTGTSDLAATRLANGRAAQELNFRFESLSTSDKCQPQESGCLDGEFAMCTSQGTFSKQGACFSGTSCFAIPLRNTNGTQVGCFPELIVEQEMIDSGAGRAIATGATTTTRIISSTSAVQPTTTTTVAFSTASTSSTPAVSSTTSSSEPVATATSPTSSVAGAPSATPTNNASAPAVVVGSGSQPARRMLRWERRGFH